IGIVLGSIIPIILNSQAKLLSHLGFAVFSCSVLAIIGLSVNYFAAKSKHATSKTSRSNGFIFGCTISILCGLTTAGQNITLSLASNIHVMALNSGLSSLTASSIIWPIFFSAAAVPFVLFMLYQNIKNKSLHNFIQPATLIYYFYIVLMSFLWV
ncbi:MAG: hypothetical protein ORN24_00605, partial [Burkholderiales bacterium]|nr:hypothetical protein [Burkholderiales bacterium]